MSAIVAGRLRAACARLIGLPFSSEIIRFIGKLAGLRRVANSLKSADSEVDEARNAIGQFGAIAPAAI
jgi:hypothetical protein